VKSPKFPDVFTLAPPLLFKSGLAVITPLSGRTVKSNVGESFSFDALLSIERIFAKQICATLFVHFVTLQPPLAHPPTNITTSGPDNENCPWDLGVIDNLFDASRRLTWF
jgi:hypothetical protein